MHWLHSVDQIVYRLGASCFTLTEFARLLFELREDRKHALASAHAESHRSASRQTLSEDVLKDKSEKPNNKLRAQATLLEDGARSLIAVPALYAARIELQAIEHIIALTLPHVSGKIPYVFQACQNLENTLALYWKAFLETRTYHAISFDTQSELFARGLTLPDFGEINGRDDFLRMFSVRYPEPLLTTNLLKSFYDSALENIKQDDLGLLDKYAESLNDDYHKKAFLGISPDGIRTFATVTSDQGSSAGLPDPRA